MGKIGCLGDVVFTVSHEQVLTVENMVWKSGVNYQEHDRHLKDPALEYTGMRADEISLDIHLSKHLGVDPLEQIVTLFKYEREGRLLPMVLGQKAYGKYRWVITDTTRKLEQFDGNGDLISADVSIQMKGYTR